MGWRRFSVRKEDRGLLLGLADEQDAFGLIEVREVLGGDVVFALAFGEGEQVDSVLFGEGLDGLDEGVGDGCEQGGGGEEVPLVVTEEGDHAELTLEFGDEDVEVQAVDTLDFQADVVAQDSGDGLG